MAAGDASPSEDGSEAVAPRTFHQKLDRALELPEPQEPPPVEIPRPVLAEVILPEPPPPVDRLKPPPPTPPKKAEKPKPPQEKKPTSTASAPQATPDQAQRAAAPAPGATPDPPSNTLPTWKGLRLRHLERHKRYTADAQRSRHEGITDVRFTMSRDGRVLSARIERAAGFASLDQQGLDLLQRAQPLPEHSLQTST